jgi:hypothetical protein
MLPHRTGWLGGGAVMLWWTNGDAEGSTPALAEVWAFFWTCAWGQGGREEGGHRRRSGNKGVPRQWWLTEKGNGRRGARIGGLELPFIATRLKGGGARPVGPTGCTGVGRLYHRS